MPGGGLARMRGGHVKFRTVRWGVINKSANKEGGLPVFFISVLFSNKYFQSSRD